MSRFLVPFLPAQQHEHHRRRWPNKPRHRYQQAALMYPLGWDATRHHRTMQATSGSVYTKVLADLLKLHNRHRACHGSPPLTISQSLNRIAQSYAEHLAATSTFEHSGNEYNGKSLGENLYMEWISHGPVKADGKRADKSWYDEIDLHDFDHPKFSKETGHFTQMVWKSTRTMGVGVAFSPDGREVYIVANYFPAGNIVSPGYFEKNVLRPTCRT